MSEDEQPTPHVCQVCDKPLRDHAIPCEVEKATQPQAPIPTNFANIITRGDVQARM